MTSTSEPAPEEPTCTCDPFAGVHHRWCASLYPASHPTPSQPVREAGDAVEADLEALTGVIQSRMISLMERYAGMARAPLEAEVGKWHLAYLDSKADVARLREALGAAENALRENITTWIALEPSLSTPYTDDPRWTPWTRFGERAFRAAGRAHEIVKRALSTDTEGDGE